MKKTVFTCLLVILMSGCLSVPRTTVFDEKTGKTKSYRLSKLFGGSALLMDGKLRVQIFISIKNQKIMLPEGSGKTKNLLIPGEMWNKADFEFYMNSKHKQSIAYSIDSLVLVNGEFHQKLMDEPKEFTMFAKSSEKITINDIIQDPKAMRQSLVVFYTTSEGHVSQEIPLRRLTVKEAKQRKSKDWAFFWN